MLQLGTVDLKLYGEGESVVQKFSPNSLSVSLSLIFLSGQNEDGTDYNVYEGMYVKCFPLKE